MPITGIFRLMAALGAVMAVMLLIQVEASATGIKTTFYGNQFFRMVSPAGKVVLINPWIKGNKDATVTIESFNPGDVDLILTTSGHGDDQGNAVEIAARTGAVIFTVNELAKSMIAKLVGLGGDKKQIYGASIGGRYTVGDVTAQLMLSIHGSGFALPDGNIRGYGGPASGVMVTFKGGPRIYMAGSTALTSDLELYGKRYQPDVALLPIVGRFMMHPDDAAYAAKLLMTGNPNLKTVVPQHFRVKGKPGWMATPAEFEAEVKKLNLALKVVSPTPGVEFTLGE